MSKEELVTLIGGAGYIGSSLIPQLLSEHYRVRVFDNFAFGSAGLKHYRPDEVEIIEGDICNVRSLSQAVAGSDTVVLLAAIVGRRIEDIDYPGIREVNLLASSIVVDAAIEHGVNRFIFTSTDSVYGVQTGVMYQTGTPDPISLYSRLKLRMEEQVIKAKRKSFHPTALRIATCFGASPRMRFDLVANALIRDAECRHSIVIDSGEQVRAMVHVHDVCRAITSCIKAHPSLVSGEIFNVGSVADTLDLNQIANIAKSLVAECSVQVMHHQADLVDYQLSCSKIQKILDFSPQRRIKEAMEEVLQLLRAGHFGDPYDPIYNSTPVALPKL